MTNTPPKAAFMAGHFGFKEGITYAEVVDAVHTIHPEWNAAYMVVLDRVALGPAVQFGMDNKDLPLETFVSKLKEAFEQLLEEGCIPESQTHVWTATVVSIHNSAAH